MATSWLKPNRRKRSSKRSAKSSTRSASSRKPSKKARKSKSARKAPKTSRKSSASRKPSRKSTRKSTKRPATKRSTKRAAPKRSTAKRSSSKRKRPTSAEIERKCAASRDDFAMVRGQFVSCDPGQTSRRASPKRKCSKSLSKQTSVKPEYRKSKAKKAWPKKGSSKMKRISAGVKASASEDLLKALRLVQKSRGRSYHTSRRAGSGGGATDKALESVVRQLQSVLRRL